MIPFGRIRERFGKTAGVAKLSDVFQFQLASSDSLEDMWLRWRKLMRQVNVISLGDDTRETLTIAGLEKAKGRSLEQHLRLRALHKSARCCVQVWISTCERRWTRAVSPRHWKIGAAMSTCACCGKGGHEKAICGFRNAKCSNCGKTGHLRAMCRQRDKSSGKSSPSSSSGKSSGKGGTSRGHTDKYYCCGQVGHRRLDCPRRNESCCLCGKRGHLSQVCRSSGGNANARPVEVEPAEPEEERVIQHVWALSVCDISGIPVRRSVDLRQL